MSNYRYHILAFLIVVVWGTTFVSTKVLINNGLTPIDIFVCRFALAYALVWIVSPKKVFANSLADELCLAALGVTGGSLYFLAENFALSYTNTSNVSLIVCTTPIFTYILLALTSKDERMNRCQIVGSLMAFAGMALVVLNGRFVLKLSPLGDVLAFAAAWSWAFYSLLMKRLMGRYSSKFINRKIFFYGLLTVAPVALAHGFTLTYDIVSTPQVFMNLIYLGVVASMICYILWNVVLKNIGVVNASNYIYLNPVVTVITAAALINERITVFAIIGMVMILGGLFLAERKLNRI